MVKTDGSRASLLCLIFGPHEEEEEEDGEEVEDHYEEEDGDRQDVDCEGEEEVEDHHVLIFCPFEEELDISMFILILMALVIITIKTDSVQPPLSILLESR